MSISRKEFERLYSAELLPSSTEANYIGDIWEWKGFLTQRLVFRADNLGIILGDDLNTALKAIPSTDANLPAIDLTSTLSDNFSATIPILKNLQLSNNLQQSSVVNFSFGKVVGKSIVGCKILLDKKLEDLKNTNFDEYKEKIRDFEIVVQYFYASNAVLQVDTTISDTTAFKEELVAQGISFTNSLDASNKETITITASNCPFAAELIKGRDL